MLFLSTGKAEVLIPSDDAHGIGMALAATPTLNGNDLIPGVEHPKANRLTDTPLQPLIHIFLPVGLIKVRLPSGMKEWIDAAIQMRILATDVSSARLSGEQQLPETPLRSV